MINLKYNYHGNIFVLARYIFLCSVAALCYILNDDSVVITLPCRRYSIIA